MDVARTLRESRRAAGLSQRALAERSGIGARTVAAVEAGRSDLTIALLQRALSACGLELGVLAGSAPVAPCPHLSEHLTLATSERWSLALQRAGRTATGATAGVDEALAAASRHGDLVVEAAAAVTVWVPGVDVELPLVVEAHRPPGVRTLPAVRSVVAEAGLVVVRPRSGPLPPGLVPVRMAGDREIWVLPPDALARQQACRPWRAGLLAAAALLADDGRDRAGRRRPPHRHPDEDEEARRLSHALRYVRLPRPSALDSRAHRLDSPVSLPQWLELRQLPPLRGQSRGRSGG